MDIWRLIERDHANITQLIREIPNALNGPGVVRSRERLLADLLDELRIHAAAVEESLMTVLGRHPETRALVGDLRRGHERAMSQLGDLAEYGRRDVSGWLNRFEDVTYLVDQHLHRHTHEVLPLARRLLSAQEASEAAQAFVRARGRALRGGGRIRRERGGPGEAALVATVGLAAVGAALLAWRFGLLRGASAPSRERNDGRGRAQPRSGLAAAAAPHERASRENLRDRQDRLLDEAVEETFPASDPISPARITR